MGRYWNFAGTITFTDKKAYDDFFQVMVDNHWYNPLHDTWVTDDGDKKREGEEDKVFVKPHLMQVTLPDTNIDNFHLLLDALPQNKWTGNVRGGTDDGGLEGIEFFPDKPTEYTDLEKWAKEHNKDMEWDEEHDDWDTETRWTIIEDFCEDSSPPSNAKKFIMGIKPKKVTKKVKKKTR